MAAIYLLYKLSLPPLSAYFNTLNINFGWEYINLPFLYSRSAGVFSINTPAQRSL